MSITGCERVYQYSDRYCIDIVGKDYSQYSGIDSDISCYNDCVAERIISISDLSHGEFAASYSSVDSVCYCSAIPCFSFGVDGWETYFRVCSTTTTTTTTTTRSPTPSPTPSPSPSPIYSTTTTTTKSPISSPLPTTTTSTTLTQYLTTTSSYKPSKGTFDSTFNSPLPSTYIPTLNPSNFPSEAPITKLEAIANVRSDEIVISTLLYIGIVYSGALLLIASIYLLLNRKEICRKGRGNLKQTWSALGYVSKILTPILNIIDLVADFWFASNILLTYWDNQILFT
eukprot:727733_1